MEWVEHRFTPEHLFKVKEILDSQAGDTEGHIIEENLEWENEPLLQENLQTEDENPVLELDDDLSNLYNRVPVYNPNRPVGKNSLQPAEGFFCDVCKRFLRNESDSQVFTNEDFCLFKIDVLFVYRITWNLKNITTNS